MPEITVEVAVVRSTNIAARAPGVGRPSWFEATMGIFVLPVIVTLLEVFRVNAPMIEHVPAVGAR